MASTLSVIGGGRMGEAIVSGLLSSKRMAAGDIRVAEPDAARREYLEREYGIACVAAARDALSGADTVLLAVKPQVIDAVAADIASGLPSGALVVSIAVGVSCSRLEAELPAGTAVVRVMPNTPAMVGEGMSVVSGGAEASAEQVERVRDMFAALGRAVVLDERHQDAAAAISGSGPAYVALFVDALARAGVRHGLTRDVAQQLAVQTLRGTAALLDGTGQHPQELIDGVTSPGGTTIAALEALEAGGFRTAVAEGVSAAVKRAKELA